MNEIDLMNQLVDSTNQIAQATFDALNVISKILNYLVYGIGILLGIALAWGVVTWMRD